MRQIEADAAAMRELLNAGKFTGMWKEGFALSHSQVSEDPFRFFVLHDGAKEGFENYDTIINAKVEKGSDKMPFKEACLSYPHRGVINTQRFASIEISCLVPVKKFFRLHLMKKILRLEGLAAFIAQHEIDHAQGIHIYDKFKR